MSISTRSLFYYGYEVTSSNQALDFNEGGSELKTTLNVGSYTLTDLMTEVARAMTAVGGQTYAVAVDRTTRLVTISAPGNFSLLTTSGSRVGSSIWSLLGFSGADKTGTNTYTGAAPSGSSYAVQFPLQSYVSSEDSRRAASAVLNKAASGRVEIVNFGEERFVEFNITYVTDIAQASLSTIRNSATGVEDTRTFLRFLITKAPFEFMANEANPSSFEKLILESTPEDQNGTAYRLKELYSRRAPGYFETGVLRFRVVLW